MKNLFKVGDKLEITKGDSIFKTGEIVSITEVDEDDDTCTYQGFNGNVHHWMTNDQFKKVEPEPSFKVGDRVRIRSWESMQKEFGSLSNVKGSFTESMKSLCGQTATIESLGSDGFVKLKDWSGDGDHLWSYSTEMLEPASKFEVGQVYKVGTSGWGDNAVIKITEVKGERAKYKMLKGKCDFGLNDFDFDSIFGKSLTLLTGKEIGEAIKAFGSKHDDKPAAVKEVKRAAEVGEYIKIVHANPVYGQHYKIGDVFKVTKTHCPAAADVSVDGVKNMIDGYEYVVLEGYQPDSVKEIKRHANKGEYIKVTSTDFPSRYKDGDILLVTDDESQSSMWRNKAVNYNDTDFVIRDEHYVVLENYKPSEKHVWTAAEVEKAKTLVLDTIREQAEKDEQIIINHNCENENDNSRFSAIIIHHDTNLQCVGNRYSFTSNCATSKCSNTDEPNEWIGKAVALCKLLHKPIPSFIMGD